MRNIKQTLFQGWHLTRFIGLGLGLFFGIQALVYKEAFAGFLSAFFLFQVVTNTGCFGSRGCTIPIENSPKKHDFNTITYTEVKKD